MIIENLKLLNFRNYSEYSVQFNNSVNLILGKNGSGKTNLIEAITVLANTKSFRCFHDKWLIKKDEQGFYVSGEFKKNGNSFKSEISYFNKYKLIRFNNDKIKKTRDYIAKILIVLYNPKDIYFINEGPEYRRKFLNITLSKTDIEYYVAVKTYNLLLSQKKMGLKLFREKKINFDVLAVLNERLIEFAEIIIKKRFLFIQNFQYKIKEKFENIMKKNYIFNFRYKTNCINLKNYNNGDVLDIKSELKYKFQKNLGAGIKLGRIMLGTQSDDFVITTNNVPLKHFLSQGERKGFILSIKLSEIDYITELTKSYPIVLLDDVFSELDFERQKFLLNELDKGYQSILTDTAFNEGFLKFIKLNKIEIK